MQSQSPLSLLSGFLFLAAFAPYIWAILRDRHKPDGAKPMKISWLIWTGIDCLTLAGMLAKHAVNGSIVGAILGALVVVVLAFKYGNPGWTMLDKICLAGAVSGIILWQALGDANIGILVGLSALLVGAVPTMLSAWRNPGAENKAGWTIWFVGAVCAVIAIPHWTIADAAQPVVFLIVETVMVSILYLKPRH